METIKLFSMALSTILTQKYHRNWLLNLFWVREANIEIQDKSLTHLVACQIKNNQLKE